MKINPITLLFAVVSFLVSCSLFSSNDVERRSELEKLPPITHTGENTFGCLVNGKAFVFNKTSQMAAIYQGSILSLSASRDRGKKI